MLNDKYQYQLKFLYIAYSLGYKFYFKKFILLFDNKNEVCVLKLLIYFIL